MSVPMSLDDDVTMSLDDDVTMSLDDTKKVERRIRKKEKVMSLDDNVTMSLDDTKRRIRKKEKVMSLDDNVTMSLDDIKRRIRKKENVMSLDDDVTMSLDDTKRRRIRKKEKVMSLDDDDYANLEKVKRKKTIMSMDDVDAVRVGKKTIMSMDDVDAVRVGRMILKPLPDGVPRKMDGVLRKMAQETENQNKISDEDLKLLSAGVREMDLFLMDERLPAMAATFLTKDWSLLRKYCFWMVSSSTENLSFEEALEHELVAICFWFLLSKACPLHVKEGVASALRYILCTALKPTNMPIDQVALAPTKMYIDQAFIDTLVVDALRSGNEEIIRQVCWTIVFVDVLHLSDTVGTTIQNQLVEIACSFPFIRDTQAATCVLRVINRIGKVCAMREKLVEAVLFDREWLLNFMRDPDEDLARQAYNLLECITRGKYDDSIWEALVDDFIPEILKRCGGRVGVSLSICGAKVVSNTINGASPHQIMVLVFGSDCIRVLLKFLDINAENVRSACMDAFENILKAGGDESNYNIYAQMIGEQHPYGWDSLDNEARNSVDILVKYAPRKWLLSQPGFRLVLWERGDREEE